MQAHSPQEITRLLVAWGNGDQSALEELAPLVHSELHRLAHHYMRREHAGHTLQTSALVNEAYIRLIDWKNTRWQNRAHFFAVSAQLMRRILVDFARDRQYLKRGGCALQVSLGEADTFTVQRGRGFSRAGRGVDRVGRDGSTQGSGGRDAFLRRSIGRGSGPGAGGLKGDGDA